MAGVAYGVRLETNFPLDDLPRSAADEPSIMIDVQRTSDVPTYTGTILTIYPARGRTATLTLTDSCFVLQIDDLFCFELWLSAKRIVCFAQHEVPYELLRYWILHQILPLFQMLSGSLAFIHGMAVSTRVAEEKEGSVSQKASCIGFYGESRAGKSTLLSYFLSRGHSLVTDDHLALSTKTYTDAVPTTPFYRPYRAIEDLGFVAENYSPETRPLRRLYMLQPAAPDADIRVEKLNGVEVVSTLLNDLQYTPYDRRVPEFLPVVTGRFRGLSQLARQIPTLRLHVPHSMDRLSEVYDFIQKDVAS